MVELFFDSDKMWRDIRKIQYTRKLSDHRLAKEIGISRTTISRIKKGKDITMFTFLTLLKWLNNDPNIYIKKYKI